MENVEAARIAIQRIFDMIYHVDFSQQWLPFFSVSYFDDHMMLEEHQLLAKQFNKMSVLDP